MIEFELFIEGCCGERHIATAVGFDAVGALRARDACWRMAATETLITCAYVSHAQLAMAE